MIVLDLTDAERLHLAAALRDRARRLQRDGRTLPPRLTELAAGLLRPDAATTGHNSPRPAAAPQHDGALLCGAAEAARLLGISVRTLRRRAATGQVPSVIDGGRRRYQRTALQRYVQTLPAGRKPP